MPPFAVVPVALLDIRHLFESKAKSDALATVLKSSLVTIAIIAICTMILFTPWGAHNASGDPLYGVNTWDIAVQLGSLNPFHIVLIFLAMLRATFVHNGWEHLLFNMAMVLAFGPALEARLGRISFLLLALGGSIVSMLAAATLAPHTNLLGMSAACFALAGAFMCLRPRAHIAVVFLIVWPGYFVPVPFMLRAMWAIIIVLAGQVYYKFGDLTMFAHLVGFIVGYVAAWLCQWRESVGKNEH